MKLPASQHLHHTPDGKNLNRQFPGKAQGTFSEAWAAWLFEEIMKKGDAYVDLHGGDMIEALVPFVSFVVCGDDKIDDVARAMGQCFGIRYLMETHEKTGSGPSGTTRSATTRIGIPTLLAEAGGQGVWDQEHVELLQAGVLRVMAYFEMCEPFEKSVIPPEVLRGWEWIRSDCDGVFYPDVQVGETVTAGQNLGRVSDVFGNTLLSAEAPVDGVILFLMTSLRINAGDPLLAIAF